MKNKLNDKKISQKRNVDKKQKKTENEGDLIISSIVYGIFDCEKKELIKVSLDKDEIDMELSLTYTEEKYSMCEFNIVLSLPT